MKDLIQNREPAAVAAFALAIIQGIYVVAGQFGYALTMEQWASITALFTLVAGFLVRANVTSNATLAKPESRTHITIPPQGAS